MFELAGVPEDIAREAMRLAAHKLPIKTNLYDVGKWSTVQEEVGQVQEEVGETNEG